MSTKINSIQVRRLATASVIMLALSAGAASAATIRFDLPLSGTFIAQGAPIDTDGDGKQAHLILAEGEIRRFGKVTIQGVGEFDQKNMPSVCPNGNPGIEQDLVDGAVIVRVESGELIRTRVFAGRACLDSITKRQIYVTFNANVIGGTGQFAGADGRLTTTAVATTVVGDPLEEQSFGSLNARSEGRIITERRNR